MNDRDTGHLHTELQAESETAESVRKLSANTRQICHLQHPTSICRHQQLTPTLVRQSLFRHLGLDLRKFSQDERVVHISRSMQTSERAQRFFLPSNEHEPSWGFGKEEDEGSERHGGKDLQAEWETPLESGTEVVLGAAVTNKRGNKGADAAKRR